MVSLLRFIKHRWLDAGDARRALDAQALERLSQHVAASEARHSGEIRLCVEASLPLSYLWRDGDARERAIALFGKLRVWDTEHNNGVLIYLLLAEHRIEIVTDRGLGRHVPASHWTPVIAAMSRHFADGAFEDGLRHAIDAVDAVLQRHFPLAPGQDNPDELPNRVDLR